jgi:hypothetical protein
VDVFREYKPIRNKIALLAVEDALGVIWAYCQYLQLDVFSFPKEIEVLNSFIRDDFPQRFISEWELELLAKEVILNGNMLASKGRTLRTWNTLSETVNAIKDLENRIYGHFGSSGSVLVEMIRIAHRQFIWQANPPNSATTIRYFKIFNRPGIDEICQERIGLDVWQTYMCGIAVMGFFLDRPAIAIPFKNEIRALSIGDFEKFFAFSSKPIADLKSKLKAEQQYNADFAYAYNSLRTHPLVRMAYQGGESYVCPLMTLLFWKFTGGLYYELIGVPSFANEFGEGFQSYVGEVIEQTCSAPIERFGEVPYAVGKLEKRTVDWIVADERSALFLECKSKRLSWGAKASLSDLRPLEADIDSMASAVVQVYKTLTDHLNNLYPHFPAKEGRKIFPAIVTLENWRMFGPVMMNKLAEAVTLKLNTAGLSPNLAEEMPYSVFAVEELEVGLQIINVNGIDGFIEGKLSSREMRQWDWHAYMTKSYPNSFPAKRLFQEEYDEMFSELFRAQNASS